MRLVFSLLLGGVVQTKRDAFACYSLWDEYSLYFLSRVEAARMVRTCFTPKGSVKKKSGERTLLAVAYGPQEKQLT